MVSQAEVVVVAELSCSSRSTTVTALACCQSGKCSAFYACCLPASPEFESFANLSPEPNRPLNSNLAYLDRRT